MTRNFKVYMKHIVTPVCLFVLYLSAGRTVCGQGQNYELVHSDTSCIHGFGLNVYSGTIHSSGLFIFRIRLAGAGSPFAFRYFVPHDSPLSIYEYRCGALILGRVKEGRFIPDAGSEIINMQHYVNQRLSVLIYNLPAKLVRKGVESKALVVESKPACVGSRPENTESENTPSRAQQRYSTNQKYDYVQDLSAKYFHKVGDMTFYGSLNEYGDFVPDPRCHIVQGKYSAEQIADWLIRDDDNWATFEFRSGNLIPGHLNRGYFVPDVGKRVIKLSGYTYSDKAINIYNLPGSFVKKSGPHE